MASDVTVGIIIYTLVLTLIIIYLLVKRDEAGSTGPTGPSGSVGPTGVAGADAITAGPAGPAGPTGPMGGIGPISSTADAVVIGDWIIEAALFFNTNTTSLNFISTSGGTDTLPLQLLNQNNTAAPGTLLRMATPNDDFFYFNNNGATGFVS